MDFALFEKVFGNFLKNFANYFEFLYLFKLNLRFKMVFSFLISNFKCKGKFTKFKSECKIYK